ncbi:major facilitator superfamily domain-containing protein [Aspergillus tamarii]|uniref:Major facilitator superfamily domain-containing protein n=1 Tax=Aspergillus tamarii TaxID=41984 RepID=A0A5N6V2J2_ASPTM|nr:major facilitator superfamily domain-containing protein [Aspergillus tamarii]
MTDMGMQEKFSGQASRNDDHAQYPDQRLEQPEQPAAGDSSTRDGAQQEKLPPNGGLQSWLNVAAAFCVFVNTWGLITTFGAFQEYYRTVLLRDQSSSAISWIGSIQATLIPMVGMITGPLVDAGYLRLLISGGSFLIVFGMMMTSLATEYYQVLLAQAFCTGLGGGVSYIPAMVVLSSSFTTKRAVAVGCASIGSSVGSVIFPIMFRRLQPLIGFPWAVRCIGFINLFMAIISCSILCRHPGKKTQARSLVEWKALKQPTFMLLSVSLTCVMLAYYVPIFYVATYARVKLNTETNLSFYLVSIINGASAFGRTVPYLLGSRVNTIFVLISCTAASAVAMYTWIATSNTAGFIVWACYWGFLSGVLVTAPTSIVAHPVFTPDKNYLGTRMGMMWGISSFGALAGAPIAGALVDLEHKNFVRAQVFAGSLMVGAVLLQMWPTIAAVRHDRNRAREAK